MSRSASRREKNAYKASVTDMLLCRRWSAVHRIDVLLSSSVFRKSREGGGGQGLGGRRTVVIGWTFRREFSSLEGV